MFPYPFPQLPDQQTEPSINLVREAAQALLGRAKAAARAILMAAVPAGKGIPDDEHQMPTPMPRMPF